MSAAHFELHRPDGAAVRAAAEAPESNATTLQQLADDLGGDESTAVSQVEGDLVEGVRANPQAPAETASQLGIAGHYAVGCLRLWAAAVDTFNTTVGDLNERIDAGEERADLQGEYLAAESQLDTDADEVAANLDAGPTAENVLSLTMAGLMPMDASSGYGALQEQMNTLLGEWFGAEFANIFGNDEDFPLVSLLIAGGKMWRMSQGIAPIFQTGIVGRMLLNKMSGMPGAASQFARWMNSAPRHMRPPNGILPKFGWANGARGGTLGWGPALRGSNGLYGMGAMRYLGVAGGVISTGAGVMNLIDQGNPVDAFEREGAGYVADVASTAFSASTTAFLVAPNPVTAGLAVGTGLVWAGAEIWDHREEIADFAGDVWDGAGDVAEDVGDTISDGVDTVKGWFS